MKIKTILALIAPLVLSSCKSPQAPINLTVAKKQVEHYYESGNHGKDVQRIVTRAIKHFKKVPPQNKATVIFDVDDTAISNYADEEAISFGYIPKLSHQWVLRADAPAIPQTKRLYDYLVGRGFTIIFLTGRKYNEYDATIKNLKGQGYTQIDKLIVRQPHELKMTAKKYKTARRTQLTQEGYKIVGNIGDQKSDLEGAHSGYRIKLPNYRYSLP